MRPRVMQGQRGLTLLELLIAVAIGSLLLLAMNGLIGQALQTQSALLARNDQLRQLDFALQRMVDAIRGSEHLLLPLAENPLTPYSESVREQFVPPIPGTEKQTAVLAVTLDPRIDRNGDGWADANNDQDFLDLNQNGVRDGGEPERIDEDFGADATWDDQAGIIGIDDDHDGLIDESAKDDDDEDEDNAATRDEEWRNGRDDDGDGAIDEDLGLDAEGDSASGRLNVDDDRDGLIDEGTPEDDDEDGKQEEDWLDPVVFYLDPNNPTTLLERVPVLGGVNGAAFDEYPLLEGVTHLRVERVSLSGAASDLIAISITTKSADGESVTLSTRVQAGSHL